MSDFNKFKLAVEQQFSLMAENHVYRVGVDPDSLWELYLASFPPGTNEIYRERTEHDCSCCKQFIRSAGNAVIIGSNGLETIWDINIGGHYQVVADAMAAEVKSYMITNAFLHNEGSVGTNHSHEQTDTGVKTWDHFYFKLPPALIQKKNIGSKLSDMRSNKDVLLRSLNELSLSAAEIILELIEQNSLYRGAEHKPTIELFISLKDEFDSFKLLSDKDNYCWKKSRVLKSASKIRNTVIGSLLDDLSTGVELDRAVASFEAKVAPSNYKRPTAPITQSMIKKAEEKVTELGIESALQRRYAVMDNVTINNVLFADRSVKQSMGVFDNLANDLPVTTSKLDKVEEVTIDTFINSILPKTTSIELLFENKHNSNLMSLVAPVNLDAPNIMKWANNFSWTYNGEVTDSMKERVKQAGGSVTGDLRFSIQWNDMDDNNDDLDAHCIEPDGNLIYFSNMRSRKTDGVLDVDITQPNHKVAVENITWPNRHNMLPGKYRMLVHCYSSRNARSGFTAQVEFDGVIHDFTYNKALKRDEKITVATVKWDGQNFSIVPALKSEAMSKELWGINTQQFHKVKMVMSSPNHWDDQTIGNKHWFFILDNCINTEKTRGFFNEYLKPELNEHRKVFEVLGNKLKTEKSVNQLSGIGFSSTQRNSVFCKVTGSFNRTIKINF